MKFLALSVEHFRCVRKANISFGPGLNVLHGPNDLGKSSLAHAIRAALLLPATSSDHLEFVNWGGSGEPRVELVFETGPQRIYRVRKTFGTGQSYLDESRNGIDFSNISRGRDVDGQLSEILRWGLAPPGGKGRPKGLPMTFLSTALLAEQHRVDAIFDQALTKDSDESGKKQLVEALRAIAEDPLFKAVLLRVQDRVDVAFTKTGGKKSGKNSPWTELREAIRAAEERDNRARQEAEQTASIELKIQELRNRQLEAKAALDVAESDLRRIEQGLKDLAIKQQILQRLEECRARLGEIRRERATLAAAEQAHADGARHQAYLAGVEASALAAMSAAQAREQAANAECLRLQGEDLVRERLLKQSTLETKRADLKTEQARNQTQLDRIRGIEGAAAKVRVLEREEKAIAATLAESQKNWRTAINTVRDLEEQERDLRAIGHLFRWRTASADVDKAARSLSQLGAWREEADRNRSAASVMQAAQPGFALPTQSQIDEFRRLDAERRVAAAKLDVGVAISFRPKREMWVSVQRDDEQPEHREVGAAAFEATAHRRIRFDIEDVGEVVILGGAEDARQEVDRLERRWLREAGPLLKAAGVDSLESLAQLAVETAKRSRELQEALGMAAQLEQRIADQPDWATLLAERQQQLARREEALGDADRAKLEKAAGKLRIADEAQAEARIDLIRAKLTAGATEEKKLNGEASAAAARHAEKQKAFAGAEQELGELASIVNGDWREIQGQVLARETEIVRELAAIGEGMTALAAVEGRTMQAADRAREVATVALGRASEAYRQAVDDRHAARIAYAESEGKLKARRETIEKLDENAAIGAVTRAEAELFAAPVAAAEASDEMLETAQVALKAAAVRLKLLEDEIHSQRGALQLVGGEVAKQQAGDAAEYLRATRERQLEMELDYDAWELLRKTMREAEEDEGSHLGRTLSGPIVARFADLTTGRYGELALGPNLETQGIKAAGEDRPVSLLSVGTRDQLSTIFRLVLAEQLNSAVLLDDQLTQSDVGRMAWLREFLLQISARIQVIVFTCRPGDYVNEESAAAGEEPVTRSIDLARVIDRFSGGAL